MNICTMNQIIAFLSLSHGEYAVARLNDGLVMSAPHVQVLVVGDPSGCRKAGSACPVEEQAQAEAAYSRTHEIERDHAF
jgi:hypothetical protein